jgi:ribosome maturation factor RimP
MDLAPLLEATLPPLGYELVDCERSPRSGLVRIFIDKPGGVDVEDCARVSHHLTRLFAVEGIDFERLEVSSPGLDRALTKPADFVRFAGAQADLRLIEPVANARRIKGILRGCEDGAVLIETGTGTLSIPFSGIGRARLVPRIEWRKTS